MQHFYFDHNATTPVAPELLQELAPLMAEEFGNPSSIHHYGQRARHRLETARRQVAALLGAEAKEIVWTSGGTEAANLAVLGAVRASRRERRHVVTSAIEHPCVRNACARLESEGVEVTYVPPQPDGVVDPEQVRRALRPDTVLVSVMHVNNELGTIQPVAEVARLAHEAGALMHSDGVQAAGRLPVDVRALEVDLYSISAHKLYAPKGAGALVVRKGVALEPLLFGGRHEHGRRAGTENVPGCSLLGRACELAAASLQNEPSRLAAARDRLEAAVLERIEGVVVNGAGAPRVANTTNLRVQAVGGEAIIIAMDLQGFALSSGSACSSGAVEPSHVLTAIGLSREVARSSIRISLGRGNDEEQVDAFVEALVGVVAHLRMISPAAVAHV